jgi:isocitrate dehydrogenase
MFDPFIQFTIGGDFGVEVFINTKKNKKIKKVNGERGFSDKTEVLRDCNVGKRYKFEKEIDTEIRDTIVNLMKQNILVEVWDWEQWSLNNLDGFYLFDIFNIVQGNICQSCIIEKNFDEKLSKFSD